MSPSTMVLVFLLIPLISKASAASESTNSGSSVLSRIKNIARENENEIMRAKNDIMKAQEEVINLKENLSSSINVAYKSLIVVLAKVDSSLVDVEGTKQKYEQLINYSTVEINSAIAFYNDKINQIFKEFTNENDIIQKQVDSFLGYVGLSGCIEASNSLLTFEKCVEPIFNQFIIDLSNSVGSVRSASSLLITAAVDLTLNVSKKIDDFRNAKISIEDEINKIKLVILNSKADFIKNKSADALERVKELLKNKESIELARNSVRSMVANIEDTQKELRNIIKSYVMFNPEGMLENIDKRVKTAIEKTENIKNNALSSIDDIETTFNLMERGTWTMYEKVTEENVKAACKEAPDVVDCVNYLYKTFDENFDYLSRNLLSLVSISDSKLSNLVAKASSDFYTVVVVAINQAEYERKMVLKYYKPWRF